MTQSVHRQPDLEEQEQGVVFSRAGFPFPMGPVIPSADATQRSLWQGLVQSGLNRPKAAAMVMVRVYEDRSAEEGWKRRKEPLTSRIDLACRNLWQRVHTQDDPEVLNTAQVSLRVIEGWVRMERGNYISSSKFSELVTDKLHQDLRNFHHKGRNDARNQSLLFAPPHYPIVGQPLKRQPSAVTWLRRYGPETRNHVRELLLEPAGEWNLLALLFNKLLHTHMGWLAPGIREQRQVHYYRPLLQHLLLCARQAGGHEAHPLAETAAGIWQNLRRMNALVFWRDDPDPLFPKHPEPIDPRHEHLPDSLHMDSSIWVDECLGEVAQILMWMDSESGAETGAEEWSSLLPLLGEVATLAWEMASYRTDPFAMGGMGIAGETSFKTEQNFKRFMEDYQAVVKGVRARVHQLKGSTLSHSQAKNLGLLPTRFLDEGEIDALENWAERPAQLRQYYETTFKMLESHGLDQFQARKGNPS